MRELEQYLDQNLRHEGNETIKLQVSNPRVIIICSVCPQGPCEGNLKCEGLDEELNTRFKNSVDEELRITRID